MRFSWYHLFSPSLVYLLWSLQVASAPLSSDQVTTLVSEIHIGVMLLVKESPTFSRLVVNDRKIRTDSWV